MLTQNDLHAIGELFKAERAETHKIVKEELAANNTVLGSIVQVEITSAAQKMATAVKTGFHETVKHINHLDKRVEALEKQAATSHKN